MQQVGCNHKCIVTVVTLLAEIQRYQTTSLLFHFASRPIQTEVLLINSRLTNRSFPGKLYGDGPLV